MIERLLRLQREGGRAVLFTVIEGEGVGSKLLVVEGGETAGDGPAELAEHADELIRGARNRTLELPRAARSSRRSTARRRACSSTARSTPPKRSAPPRSCSAGRTIVADARPKFATRERIPSADELIVAWPEETFAQVQPDHATAIVVLTHDDKFDLPALELALASDAFYIGLIGGRRNQEKKRERLREAGHDEEALARISGPCGLDLGADSVPETALSILAEALAARNGRAGGPLRDTKQRIHVEAS